MARRNLLPVVIGNPKLVLAGASMIPLTKKVVNMAPKSKKGK